MIFFNKFVDGHCFTFLNELFFYIGIKRHQIFLTLPGTIKHVRDSESRFFTLNLFDSILNKKKSQKQNQYLVWQELLCLSLPKTPLVWSLWCLQKSIAFLLQTHTHIHMYTHTHTTLYRLISPHPNSHIHHTTNSSHFHFPPRVPSPIQTLTYSVYFPHPPSPPPHPYVFKLILFQYTIDNQQEIWSCERVLNYL